MQHKLKSWPHFFQAAVAGKKKFELRIDDRPNGFFSGDTLLLQEWDPAIKEYTGMSFEVRVVYILRFNDDLPGLEEGYVIMGIEPIYWKIEASSNISVALAEAAANTLALAEEV